MDTVHVEICQKAGSTLPTKEIEELVREELNKFDEVVPNTALYEESFTNDILRNHVESMICSCNYRERNTIKVENTEFLFHTYRLTQEDAAMETMQNDTEELPAVAHWILPAAEFYYLWENLIYDSDMKENLLNFVETSMVFSDQKVNPNIISWNKVILLHGPPGTGKTSLCKALAQKIAIRLNDRFTRGELVEINSHSLFSKWFSESGKLVMKLFSEIKILLEDSKAFVCILIDEVESLAHVRKACTNGIEPSDSIRVVNALLTQLDQIKRYPNVLILTTSNMTEAIDLAFVDRADIKQYIGPPTDQAIYKIYSSCLKELMKTNLLEAEDIYDMHYLKMHGYEENQDTKNSLKLLELCRESEGLSGRALRKVPFLAHALYVQSKKSTVCRFLRAMHLAIERQKENVGES